MGAALCLIALGVAAFGRLLAPTNPDATNLVAMLKGPSSAHIFGTDELGRDLFSRVLVGASYTVPAALIVVGLAVMIGSIVGVIAGYYGGLLGNVIMRITDLFLSYPSLLLAIAVAAALGPGLSHSVLALLLVLWSGYARLAYVQVVSIRNRLYMDAARMAGTSTSRNLLRHIAPNAIAPVLIKATMDAALAVEWIAGLGFVGLGAQPPTPEWGSMISASTTYVLRAWWYVLFPCLGLLTMTLGFNLFGGALDQWYFGRRTGPARGRTARSILSGAGAQPGGGERLPESAPSMVAKPVAATSVAASTAAAWTEERP
jgi:peptide/nickel transport system permease protein